MARLMFHIQSEPVLTHPPLRSRHTGRYRDGWGWKAAQEGVVGQRCGKPLDYNDETLWVPILYSTVVPRVLASEKPTCSNFTSVTICTSCYVFKLLSHYSVVLLLNQPLGKVLCYRIKTIVELIHFTPECFSGLQRLCLQLWTILK
jgi:hypothetical protein